MIKRVSLVRRRADLTHEQFIAHWTGPHAAIVRQLPGVRGLRFGVVTADWAPPDVAWDGVGEVWFDSIEAAQLAFSTEPFHSMLVVDRQQFLGEAQSCFVEELTMIDPA